jgi:hypothetical protein
MARPPDDCPPNPASIQGVPSGKKYENCIQTQPAVMPTKEGFENPDSNTFALGAIVVIGLAVFLLIRKH